MNERKPSASSSVLLALLGGATLGAIAAVLTTPKTGKEVRARLRAVAEGFRKRAPEDLEDDSAYAVFI